MKQISKELIEKVIEDGGLKESKDLKEAFLPFVEQANEWMVQAQTLKVESEQETDKMEKAKQAHKALRKVANNIEDQRKEFKQESLNKGRAIDAIAKEFQALISPVTDFLKEQADYLKIQELKRQEELRLVRDEELKPYANFVPIGTDTGTMSEQDYNQLFKNVQMMKKVSDLEAEEERKRQEQQRIEAEKIREEAAKLRAENEKLQQQLQNNTPQITGETDHKTCINYMRAIIQTYKNKPNVEGKYKEFVENMVIDLDTKLKEHHAKLKEL